MRTLANGLGVTKVIRTMPNTPCSIGQGVNVWCATSAVEDAEREKMANMLGRMGEEIFVADEKFLDMVSNATLAPILVQDAFFDFSFFFFFFFFLERKRISRRRVCVCADPLMLGVAIRTRTHICTHTRPYMLRPLLFQDLVQHMYTWRWSQWSMPGFS